MDKKIDILRLIWSSRRSIEQTVFKRRKFDLREITQHIIQLYDFFSSTTSIDSAKKYHHLCTTTSHNDFVCYFFYFIIEIENFSSSSRSVSSKSYSIQSSSLGKIWLVGPSPPMFRIQEGKLQIVFTVSSKRAPAKNHLASILENG